MQPTRPANCRPIDILLVEDEESDVKITLRAFKQSKIQNNLFVVRDGQEALDFVRHAGAYTDTQKYPRPDLILLDLQLPKLGGMEVLKRLKQDPQFKFIPVVMLTSSKADEDVVSSYREGAASFIPKPVGYESFLKVVEAFNFYWQIVNRVPDGKRGL